MNRSGGLAAFSAFLLLLVACGGSDDGSKAEGSTTTEVTTTTVPPLEADAAGLSGFSECVDPLGDGDHDDLLSARLTTQGEVLTIGYETAAPLAGSSFSYYINIFSEGYQIGLRNLDGHVARFVADLNDGQENLTSAYTLDGNVATLAVPLSAVPRLEQPFDYTAVITVNGRDVDECAGRFEGDK